MSKDGRERQVMDESLSKAVSFLEEVGIQCTPMAGSAGFLEHVRIVSGGIQYDAEKATASNLLHEAGHLAIIPLELRHLAEDDLQGWIEKAEERLAELMAAGTDPDAPIIRAYMQTSDPEATAWAFAAGKAAGLKDEDIILDHQYDNEGDSIRLALSHGAYVGIHGLRHAGFLKSVKDYPALLKWLQD